MKVYPKYKASGIDWLGEIPDTWDFNKLKILTNQVSIPAFEKADDETYIALENIESWTGNIIPSEEFNGFDSTARKFTKEDVLFGKLRPYLAKVIIPDFKGVCVSELIVIRPIKLNRKYLFFILLNPNFIDFVSQTAEGTKMPRTSWSKICDLKFPVPSFSEQQTIVDFLDYKTGQCDRFIANRQKQIQLLNEQKASIINKAITKGINPNAKMKPSGIEWIGDIPEYWNFNKLKFLTNHISIPASEKADDETYIALENIESWTGNIIPSEEFNGFDSTARKFTKEDVLFGKLRPYLAKVIIPDFKGVCVSELIVIRPIKINRKYLFFVLLNPNFIDFVSQTAEGTKMPRTSWNKICDLKFPVPSLSEQQEITDFITKETSKIETLIAKYQKQIDLMQEYRTALISQAVTGKIDVRDWQLPHN